MDFRKLLSCIVTVGILFVVYRWLHEYDWGQPFTKFICFAILFGLVLKAGSVNVSRLSRPVLLRIELVLLLLATGWVVLHYAPVYLKQLSSIPKVDIGYTTEHAATMLFREHRNPYRSAQINIRPELPPYFRGFHYGPLMLVGYAAGVVSPGWGFKVTSLIFLLGTLVALGVSLARLTPSRGLERINLVLSFLLLAILPERLWYELFWQGANDIFPVLLLALSVLFLQRERWAGAGALIGLSFSAKFSPAIFFLAVLLRRRLQPRIFVGFLLGCTPLLLFLVWAPRGALNNIFLVRFLLRYDATSLYSITPPGLHFLFPLCQMAAVVGFIWRDFRAPLTLDRIIPGFILLLIVEEVSFKEIHANHLIWFVPFIAYVVSRHRYTYLSPFEAREVELARAVS